MSEDVSRYLRNIPSMDKILSLEWVQDYYPMIGRKAVKSLIESMLEDFRASMLSGEAKEVDIERLMSDVKKTLEKSSKKA
ncbi:hypothetical protein [Acetomicrobium sp.]|uniref:hypothetical protein n=1 Tax=Acetomicrobium sp. TaxID=1872099 RepID=UPI002FC6B568